METRQEITLQESVDQHTALYNRDEKRRRIIVLEEGTGFPPAEITTACLSSCFGKRLTGRIHD
jgi:hypothetical protein